MHDRMDLCLSMHSCNHAFGFAAGHSNHLIYQSSTLLSTLPGMSLTNGTTYPITAKNTRTGIRNKRTDDRKLMGFLLIQ